MTTPFRVRHGLTVEGSANVAGNTSITGSLVTTGSVTISNGGGTYQAGSIYSDANWGMLFRSAQASPSTAIFAWKSSDNLTEYARIAANGNVGIGTTTPTAKLTVNGSIALIKSDNLGAAQITHYTNDKMYIRGGTSGTVVSDDNGQNAIQINNAGFIAFETNNGDERMRIAANGNVGIGTTTPSSPLDIVRDGGYGVNYTLLRVNNSATDGNPSSQIDISHRGIPVYLRNQAYFSPVTGSRFSIIAGNNSNTEQIIIDSNGVLFPASNVGIGTSSPAYPLQVRRAGGAGSLGITIDNVYSGSDRTVKYLSVGDSGTDTSGHAFYSRNGSTTDIGALYITPSGNVGIGNSSASAKLLVQGTTLFRSTGAAVTLDSASATDARMEFLYNGTRSGYISVDNSTLSVVANSAAVLTLGANAQERMRIAANGNVGIGTTAPGYKLDVTGTVRIKNTSTGYLIGPTGEMLIGEDIGALYIGQGFGVSPVIPINYGSTGTTYQRWYSGGSERMRLDSSGNLGIGTVTPGVKLDVNGDARIANGSSIYWYNYNSTTNGPRITGSNDGLNIESGPSSAGRGALTLTGHNNTTLQTDAGHLTLSASQASTSEARIMFNTAGSERMRITSTGDVGIGTSSPASRLQVFAPHSIDTVGATNKWSVKLHDSSAVAINVGGSLLFQGSKNSSGATGNFAGIAGLKENATENDESGYLALYSVPNSTQLITERMRITSIGDVGIGTTTPSEKLDVSGNIRASGTVSAMTIAENSPAIATSGFSLTGNNAFSVLDIEGQWNTTGNPSAIKLNINNINSGSSSSLLELGTTDIGVYTSRFKVAKNGSVTVADAANISVGLSTGTKIGTANTQKIGFWNATPVVQPTTSVGSATFVANTGTAVNDASTFDGYTLRQIVKALRDIGILA